MQNIRPTQNSQLIKVIEDKDFAFKDTITEMLVMGRNFRHWLSYFGRFHILLQAYWWEAGYKSYILDLVFFNKDCIEHPDWHFEFCMGFFEESDWVFYFQHYPAYLETFHIRDLKPDVWNQFCHLLEEYKT